MTIIYIAAAVYAVTMLVGFAARLQRTRFGFWHHVAFFFVCATALAAVLVSRNPWLILTLVCLVVIPFTPGKSDNHWIVAVIGSIGLIAAIITQ